MKRQRQQLIVDIVRRMAVGNQEQLVGELARRGVATNQTTVSRDIKELGLIKIPHNEGFRYMQAATTQVPRVSWSQVARVIEEHVTLVDASDSLIVLKTPPGRAHLVAVTLDGLDDRNIVGTLAGDDTVLLIPRSNEARLELMSRFNRPL